MIPFALIISAGQAAFTPGRDDQNLESVQANTMPIILDAIRFNIPQKSTSAHVLNLRRSLTTPQRLPEWQRTLSQTPEQSPVGYQIALASRRPCQISARFRRVDPDAPGSMTVRAIADESMGRNILGPVASKEIQFRPDHLSNWVTFDLREHHLSSVGVGVWDITWKWEYHQEKSWYTFDSSQHRVFTTLKAPQEPWQQQPYTNTNVCMPWIDALEFACRWAQGARTEDEVAIAITRQINQLGPALIEYECGIPGNAIYGYFQLSSFLDLLRGGPGRGHTVACTDCSCAVVAFSNLLGCNLWKIDINTDPLDDSAAPAPIFRINPILVIGSNDWGIPCGLTGFSYHSVACKGELDPDDRVFDACLRVSQVPGKTEHPVLPANMRYGSPGSGDYLDRLVAPEDRGIVIPQGWGRYRPNLY